MADLRVRRRDESRHVHFWGQWSLWQNCQGEKLQTRLWPDPTLRSYWLTKGILSFSHSALEASISGRRLRYSAYVITCVGLLTSFHLLPSMRLIALFTSARALKNCWGEKKLPYKTQLAKSSLEREIFGLRVKEFFLEEKVDFISKERYALIYEKWILKNRLADFNSWREYTYNQKSFEKVWQSWIEGGVFFLRLIILTLPISIS